MDTTVERPQYESPFLRLPAELRLMIYQQLLSPNNADRVYIKTRERYWKNAAEDDEERPPRRTCYYALDRRSLGRCSYKTTYSLDGTPDDGQTALYPTIMAVNRKIYHEATYHLYASHDFHFGTHLDAIGPFIADLTPSTRNLVNSISLRCYLYSPCCCADSDWRFWNTMSQRLRNLPKLRKLRLSIQGGRPTGDWDGPKDLSVSDIKLLYATHHECLDWARELAAVESLEDVEIEADVRPIPRPETTATLIYAALSASIEGSLVEFLKTELNVPVRLREKKNECEDKELEKAEDQSELMAESEGDGAESAVEES